MNQYIEMCVTFSTPRERRSRIQKNLSQVSKDIPVPDDVFPDMLSQPNLALDLLHELGVVRKVVHPHAFYA